MALQQCLLALEVALNVLDGYLALPSHLERLAQLIPQVAGGAVVGSLKISPLVPSLA